MSLMDSASNEIWKALPPDFPAGYEVSSLGRVRNVRTDRVLTPMMTGAKRRSGQTAKVRLCSNPRLDYPVAHLVLTTFVGARPHGYVSMHRDDDKRNNTLVNLSWGTHKDNAVDMIYKNRGASQKLSIAEVAAIRHRRSTGETGRSLANEFGVSEQRICDIFKGRTCLQKA